MHTSYETGHKITSTCQKQILKTAKQNIGWIHSSYCLQLSQHTIHKTEYKSHLIYFTTDLKKLLKIASLPNILCMFSSAASVSVALVEIFLWQGASLLQIKGDSQTDGHTGRLLGLVFVCFHSNCQAAMVKAWWRWCLLRDSWTARVAMQSKSLAKRPKRTKKEASVGSGKTPAGLSCSGPMTTMHQQEQHWCFDCSKSTHG